MPLSAHQVSKVSSIYLNIYLSSLQKKITSWWNRILINWWVLRIVGRMVALSLFFTVYIKFKFGIYTVEMHNISITV